VILFVQWILAISISVYHEIVTGQSKKVIRIYLVIAYSHSSRTILPFALYLAVLSCPLLRVDKIVYPTAYIR